ncbi:MAG: hypothetical protein ABJQ38_07945, partial [Flavobacteriaceae bacterium]
MKTRRKKVSSVNQHNSYDLNSEKRSLPQLKYELFVPKSLQKVLSFALQTLFEYAVQLNTTVMTVTPQNDLTATQYKKIFVPYSLQKILSSTLQNAICSRIIDAS